MVLPKSIDVINKIPMFESAGFSAFHLNHSFSFQNQNQNRYQQSHLIPRVFFFTPEVILYTMSYVPPHLRNFSAGKTTTLNSDGAAADYFSSKLSSHQSRIHCNGELDKSSSNGYSNSSRRSSVNYSTASRTAIPDPEFPQWKPSERVLRLKSEQV